MSRPAPKRATAAAAAPRGTDYMRQNRQQILEQQQVNRERVKQDEFKAEKQKALVQRQKAQWTGGRNAAPPQDDAAMFRAPPENVEIHTTYGRPQDDVEIAVFVRECDTDGVQFGGLESALQKAAQSRQQQQLQQQPQASAPAPRQQPAGGKPGPVQQRSQAAAAGAPALGLRRPPSNESRAPGAGPQAVSGGNSAPASRGQVPAYLRQRKAEMEAEKAEARRIADLRTEQSKYPPGHRPVGEEERSEILARLAQRKVDLQADLGRLPMRYDTQAIANRRKQIEAELSEVEAAEQKFSVKKQLFVPI